MIGSIDISNGEIDHMTSEQLKSYGKYLDKQLKPMMLKPHEIQAAMAFAADYKVLGNSREKVKQLGNAVTPPAMKWLVEQCVKSLM